MRFVQLPLYCTCGRAASRIRDVGLTTDHQLVVGWWCSGCKKHVLVVKALADCWRDCPKPKQGRKISPVSKELEPDERFLHHLGVRFPEETE